MAKSKVIFIGLCLVLVVLIIWRYQVLESSFNNYQLREYNDSEEEIVLNGKVIKEPDLRETNTKLTVKTEQAKFLVTISRYPEYKYGDELRIKGKLQTPVVFEDFNYQNYLKKDGIYSVVYYPEVELIPGLDKKSLVYSKVLEIKDKMRQGIYKAISPPQSEILGAMILGDKNRMSYDLKEKLNIAGVRHVTAVSGMHIVILSGILISLFLALGFWKKQAVCLSLAFIFFFIALTGFQVSSIRAGIMGSLFLGAPLLGRKSNSIRALIIAGLIMLVFNPLLLFYDAGFQLSFLAALGIISLSPFLKKWLKWNVLTMTISAYIFTLPILIYNFGRISLVALLTNVLIVPIIYPIMILGFIFVLVGLISSSLAWLLAIPLWLFLTYILKIVDFFSHSWAAKTIENIHWFWPLLFYLFLAISVWHLKTKEKTKLDFRY
jgi:competence protein ComEC